MMLALLTSLIPLAILLVLSICAALLSAGFTTVFGELLPQAKIIGKLTLILLLLGVFPLQRRLRLSWQDLGLTGPSLFFRQLGLGLLLSLATLTPILLGSWLFEIRIWDHSRSWTPASLGGKIGLSLLLALLIGIGEELLFRGLLLAGLRRKLSLFTAMTLSSLYFAALHFLKPHAQAPDNHEAFADALQLLGDAYAHWLSPQILPAMASLFVIGWFLARLRLQHPQGLALCIGCHAGWVWQIKMFKDLFNLNPQSDYLFLVSGYDGVVGPLIGFWLLAALLVWSLISPISNRSSQAIVTCSRHP